MVSRSRATRSGVTKRRWARGGWSGRGARRGQALVTAAVDRAGDGQGGGGAGRAGVAEPLCVRFARALVERKKGGEAQVFIQELLAGTLPPAARAWVLLLTGEASRAQG